ncbi:hypothetical protein [Alkalihalobacterium sp. APHAB7]|uniref:hypothetical protein n=1 Tax=Alkalihalobacterium sp. APHAB7 TaxID=3402081 RepID=UPI003AB09873
MESYEIKHMIIDDDFEGDPSVTAEFTYDDKDYSITFHKTDMELMNSWMFASDTTLPANLPDAMIESIREDIKKKM